jgi:hypothetical protein
MVAASIAIPKRKTNQSRMKTSSDRADRSGSAGLKRKNGHGARLAAQDVRRKTGREAAEVLFLTMQSHFLAPPISSLRRGLLVSGQMVANRVRRGRYRHLVKV